MPDFALVGPPDPDGVGYLFPSGVRGPSPTPWRAIKSTMIPTSLPLAALTLTLPVLAQQPPPVVGGTQRLPIGPIGEDCNGNGILDQTDIAYGLSSDCNLDGIPDECQAPVEGLYLLDDWTTDGAAGWGFPYYCWLTQHEARAGQEVITEIETSWGLLPPGSPVTVGIWSDPDGDTKPYDAKLLLSVEATTELEYTGELVRIDIPDFLVGPAGTSFFVGVIGEFSPFDYPAAYDADYPSFRSWIVMSNNPVDPDDLQKDVAQIGIVGDADFVLRGVSCPTGHCGELTDFDFDGVFDECQQQDCNGNGVPDVRDIANGTSADCQGDGIPDECQFDSAIAYALDDGEMDTAVGTGYDYYGWMTHLTVQPGAEIITHIESAWGEMPPGSEITLGLWNDPNGDGDPTDAQLILEHKVLSSYEFENKWLTLNIPDTYVGPPGTSFFVGAFGFFKFDPNLPTAFAAGLDTDSPDLEAWFVSKNTPIDLNNLSAGAAEFGRLNTVCACDGDWTLRAISCFTEHCGEADDLDGNGVADDCDPDCDYDDVPDGYELLIGIETDCDGNGVPDDCEVLLDCDGNFLPDLCQSSTSNGLAAAYFPGPDLSGDPIATIDSQVLFDFTAAPPFAGYFPETNFSVRWTGAVQASTTGVYGFGLLHDGGVRLWVNGQLVIDAWSDTTGAVFDANTIELAGGFVHELRLEYYHDWQGGLAELQWQPPGGSMLPIQASDLRPIYDRNGDGIPDGCQIVSDCNANGVEDAEDIFNGTSLDCDGDGVVDECQGCSDSDGNGLLDTCEVAAGNGVVGQYFRLSPVELTFQDRVTAQVDPNIDFDWGLGAPVGVPADAFGVRWTGTITTLAASGNYTFWVDADDGARLWIDGLLVVDGWSGAGTASGVINLPGASDHTLRLDYRELGGNASVRLRWAPPGGFPATVPSSALRAATDLNGDGVSDLDTDDCNLNGIPDALDVDVNGNCIPDDCEGGVGYWRFEEPGGTTVFDDTPNGLDGTLGNLPFRISDVPVNPVPLTGAFNGQALDNGWLGGVRVPNSGGLLDVGGNSFTLEAWVRLDVLGYVNVNGRQWLAQKKPSLAGDTQLEYGFLAQAGDFGLTGRELAFRYGTGSGVEVAVSSIKVQDYDWHFLSLAYDAVQKRVRFGIDDQFEFVSCEKPALNVGGDLVLGYHENTSGQTNQWLFGYYDEPRFTRAYLPTEALLNHQ